MDPNPGRNGRSAHPHIGKLFLDAARVMVASAPLFALTIILSFASEIAVEHFIVLPKLNLSSGNASFSSPFSSIFNERSAKLSQGQGYGKDGTVKGGKQKGGSFLARYVSLLESISGDFNNEEWKRANERTGNAGVEGQSAERPVDDGKVAFKDHEEHKDKDRDVISTVEDNQDSDHPAESRKHLTKDEVNQNNSSIASDREDLLGHAKRTGEDKHRNEEASDVGLPNLKLVWGNGSDLVDNELKDKSSQVEFPYASVFRFNHDHGAQRDMGLAVLWFLFVLVAIATLLVTIAMGHAVIFGAVVHNVVSTLVGRRATLRRAFKEGCNCGIARLIHLLIISGLVRGLQYLLFMKMLFSGILEMDKVENFILRLSLMPFALLEPFKDKDIRDSGLATSIAAFVCLDYICDAVTYVIYIVACCVSITERNRRVAILYRSWNLVQSMEAEAIMIKLLEAILCGRTCRWMLRQVMGQFPSIFLTSVAQSYFTALWVVFYAYARQKKDGMPLNMIFEDFLRIR